MELNYKRNEQVKLLQIVKKANTATTTAQGCCAIITRFWNGNYDAVFKEMGYDSPSDLRKYLLTHKFCPELYTIKGKKERIAIFREKKKEDRRPESLTIDAKGRNTYPYLLDKKGNVLTEWVATPITRWTPSVIVELLLQEAELSEKGGKK